ncbi:MAG: RHS repeat-associated core domain-containing protein [Prosthecobacter sp.]
MGNRDSATQGTAVAEQSSTGYSTNLLQQYDGLTHSRSVEITGQAVAGAVVELALDGGDANAANGGQTIMVDRSLPQHQTGDPHSFRYVHTVTGTTARWLHVQIKASAGGIDLIRQGFVYVPPASETVAHDDDGNLTEDAQWVYTWDAENRMTSATQKAIAVAAGLSATPPARKQLTFAYDYRNRRIAKRVFQLHTSNLEPETSTWKLVKDLRFVYDGYQMIAELDHSFATGTGLEGSRVNRTFLWGPDVSGTMTGAGGVGGLLSTTYQGVTYHVCSDANGNVTGLVPGNGPQAGTLIARYDYDPFGNRITNTGPDVDLCPFGFSTKYTDSETGFIDYGLRIYGPGYARWLSKDPIGERGGVNLYGFVGNDPVNFVDYLGREKWAAFQSKLPGFKTPQDMWNHYAADKLGKMKDGPYVITCLCGIVDLIHLASGVKAVKNGKSAEDFMRERFDQEWGMPPNATNRDRADVGYMHDRGETTEGKFASGDDHPSEALGALSALDPNWQKGVSDVLTKCKPIPDDVYDQFVKDNTIGPLGVGASSAIKPWPWAFPRIIADQINASARKIGKPCCPKFDPGASRALHLKYFQQSGLDWQSGGSTPVGPVPPGTVRHQTR